MNDTFVEAQSSSLYAERWILLRWTLARNACVWREGNLLRALVVQGLVQSRTDLAAEGDHDAMVANSAARAAALAIEQAADCFYAGLYQRAIATRLWAVGGALRLRARMLRAH